MLPREFGMDSSDFDNEMVVRTSGDQGKFKYAVGIVPGEEKKILLVVTALVHFLLVLQL